jgi:hypothetical protein
MGSIIIIITLQFTLRRESKTITRNRESNDLRYSCSMAYDTPVFETIFTPKLCMLRRFMGYLLARVFTHIFMGKI